MLERFYAVDRLEGSSAMLVDDAGKLVTVPRSRLPKNVAPGDVLRVPERHGTPDWGTSVVDTRETERRGEELNKRDPGGDTEA